MTFLAWALQFGFILICALAAVFLVGRYVRSETAQIKRALRIDTDAHIRTHRNSTEEA